MQWKYQHFLIFFVRIPIFLLNNERYLIFLCNAPSTQRIVMVDWNTESEFISAPLKVGIYSKHHRRTDLCWSMNCGINSWTYFSIYKILLKSGIYLCILILKCVGWFLGASDPMFLFNMHAWLACMLLIHSLSGSYLTVCCYPFSHTTTTELSLIIGKYHIGFPL